MQAKKRCEVKWVAMESPFNTHFHADERMPNVLYRMSSDLAKRHSVKGKLLDVGSGSNEKVMKSLKDMGVAPHSIDAVGFSLRYPPEHRTSKKITERKVEFLGKDDLGEHYWGDILDIHHKSSDLKNKKFDYITFWGSWVGHGGGIEHGGAIDNQNFGHNMPIVLKRGGIQEKDFPRCGELLKENALRACKYALNPNGKIAIVSTRYAWHGARTNFSTLSHELGEHKKVIDWFKKLGAKKIHVYARPWEWADKQVDGVCKAMEKDITGKEVNLDIVPEKLLRLARPSVEGTKSLDVTKLWAKMRKARESAIEAVKQYINGEIGKGDAMDKMMDYRPIKDRNGVDAYLGRVSSWRKIMGLRHKERSPLIDAIVAEF